MTQKYCPTYPGYSVSDDGRVFTHRRRFGLGMGKGGGVRIDKEYSRLLVPYQGHGRYNYVSISTSRGQRSIPIHVLLMDAFVGPCPSDMEVRHLDGNPTNNDLSNLEYGTAKQNAADRIKHGTQKRGVDHAKAKLDESSVIDIRKMYSNGEKIAAIARGFQMAESTIRDIVKGKRWTHVE